MQILLVAQDWYIAILAADIKIVVLWHFMNDFRQSAQW